MKKTLTLEQKIEAILRHYWFDPYSKERYIADCTKKIVELLEKEYLKQHYNIKDPRMEDM